MDNTKFVSIKNWIEEDRPREKMARKGADALSNTELLAILINTGTTEKSAIDIAKDILALCDNNLVELSKLSLTDLKKTKGIGEKKAITLLAALELGKRRQLTDALVKPVVTSSRSAYEILSPYFVGKNVEIFYVIFLNQAQKVNAIEQISQGGMTATVADTRVIFRRALEIQGTARIIVAHNHPSGNLKPSDADKQLTSRIKDAGKYIDIQLIDHLIITDNSYFSFADEGYL